MIQNNGNLIIKGKICTPYEIIQRGFVCIENGVIIEMGEGETNTTKHEVIDVIDSMVLPGPIDLQVNGGGGYMFTSDCSDEALIAISEALAKVGTTAILPTIISEKHEVICDVLSKIANFIENKRDTGASFLGMHLEGPYLGEKKRGAHAKEQIRAPELTEFKELVEAAKGQLRMLTLAPELNGANDLIRFAFGEGIIVSAGHTTANYEQMKNANRVGLSFATHIFNGMEGLGSREPGTVGAILALDQIKTGIIADCKHVHPMSIKTVIRSKNVDNVCIVTDAVAPVGTKLNSYNLYGTEVTIRDGGCYTPDGVLAGSVSTMIEGIRNVHQKVGISLTDSIRMGTLNPAKALGVSNKYGNIAIGMQGTLVIVNDDFRLQKVIIKGKEFKKRVI